MNVKFKWEQQGISGVIEREHDMTGVTAELVSLMVNSDYVEFDVGGPHNESRMGGGAARVSTVVGRDGTTTATIHLQGVIYL